MSRTSRGFSLIEIMLAVAIIGIVAGIAIPSFLGSRRHARYVGDARTNAAIIQMNLETIRGDTGLFPTAGAYVWAQGVPPVPNPVPRVSSFTGSTKLDFTLTINADRLTFTIAATDPRNANELILTMNQNGQIF